jgi:hypothetical protein
MKPSDLTSPEHLMLRLQLQTINECPLRRMEPGLAHSKGKPDVAPQQTTINVRFAKPLNMKIPVRVVEAGWSEWQEADESNF